MTDAELRDAAVAHLKQTTTGYRKANGQAKPPPWPEGSTHWKPALDLLAQIGSNPPPPVNTYAPRAYNSTHSADARFCCAPQYGCVRDGAGWVDAKGIRYDEGMRDLGGRTNNSANPIPQLKGANSMDGKEPCDEYTGPTGQKVGGAAGYPAASFER